MGDLQTKNKSGKAALRVPEGAKVLPPQIIASVDAKIAAITNIGKLLVFPISELPELSRGKGNKIIGIPKAKFESGEEFLKFIAVIEDGSSIKLINGKTHYSPKTKDLENFLSSRGKRGLSTSSWL